MLNYDPESDEYYEINEDAITYCPPLEADEVARLFNLPLDVIMSATQRTLTFKLDATCPTTPPGRLVYAAPCSRCMHHDCTPLFSARHACPA
jgi:hypothetical protein